MRTSAHVAAAVIPVQVDIGFGDAVTPGPLELENVFAHRARAALQKKTYERTTTFLRQGAPAGAVGSMQAEWKDQRETEPSVTES